jgi:hypothetical protein
MKFYTLSLFLIIGVTFQLIGQNIEVKVDKEIFCHADKSLIFLSNAEGEILHDWHLTSSDFIEDVVLNCYLEKEKYLRLDLTIFSEYLLNIDGKEYSIFNAITEQNISEKHNVKKINDCNYPKPTFEYQDITINISGTEELDKIILTSFKHDYSSSVKTKKGKTRIRYQLPVGFDFLITLFCNNEPTPRTIYLKHNEIQPVINLDWSTMNKDVKEITIPILASKYWYGKVTATNEDTGKLSTLFNTQSISDSADDTSFFIPQNEFFYDFKLSLRRADDDYERRRLHFTSNSEDFAVKTIKYPELEYDIDFSENKAYTINFNNDTFDLSFKYTAPLYIMSPTDPFSSTVKHEIHSQWLINNNSQNDVSYTLPNLNSYLSIYPSIELLKRIYPTSVSFSHKINSNQVITVEDYLKRSIYGW